ncbi:type II toxin-antitoxin system death-on-curing family toxin, partial [Chitinophaga polysaccharea]|uniref:type II toxin-antitoxin system death-on-curing family toxin n=1 Tax=Chitinophaga polysaccharea TaxID=1293035 RepID=UPI00115A1C83
KKYNGIEYTSELDLDIYDAQLRNLDPQIGRWNQIDPKIENMEAWSPYASNYDNPIRYNDFLGDEPNGPGDPIKKVGLVTGREYNLTAPTGIGSGLKFIGQYIAGTANEIVAGINQNLNPVYAAVNGVQALSTGKDIQTGRAMSTGEASMSVLSAIPISKAASMVGKIAGFAEGMIAREATQGATQGVMQAGAKEAFNPSTFAEDIVKLNKATDGGGVLLNGTPSSAINSAMYYETAAEQGAAIFRSISAGHMFVNGNKRTAVAAFQLFAQQNDLKVVGQKQMMDASTKVATGVVTEVSEIVKMLTK